MITQATILIKRYKFLTIPDFIARYHPGISAEAIVYQMYHGKKVDYYQYQKGHSLFVVLTPKTLQYKPTPYKPR